MKRIIYLLLLAPLAAAEPELRELLRDALYAEEVERDPAAAAAGYEKILGRFDAAKPFAASALLRLAEIRRGQDREDEAVALYRRLMAEFPEEAKEAEIAAQRLVKRGIEIPEAGMADEETAELRRLRELEKTAPDLLLDPQTLKTAVTEGWPRVVAFLLEQGADPTASEILWVAAGEGYLEIVRLLLENATPGQEALEGAISLAIENKRTAVTDYLLKDADERVLKIALAGGTAGNIPEVIALVLEHGSDPDTIFPGVLRLAASKGSVEAARMLLEAGADPNAATAQGETPLHAAARREAAGRSVQVLTALLEAGADPNPKTHPETPLDLALDQPEKAEILLAAGATPKPEHLRELVKTGNRELLELILEKSPELETRLAEDSTLLRLAAEKLPEMTKLLIKSGARPSKEWLAEGLPGLLEPDSRPLLVEAFLLPQLFESGAVHLLVDVSSNPVVELATRNGTEPPSLAKLLYDHRSIQIVEPVGADVRWVLWRAGPDGTPEATVLDLIEGELPELRWGDVIQRQIVGKFSELRYRDGFDPELAWTILRRISFPVTFVIDSEPRELTLNGGRLVHDPTSRELPLLPLDRLIPLVVGKIDPTQAVVIEREGWPEFRLAPGTAALPDFELQTGDRIRISRVKKDDEFAGAIRLEVPDTLFIQTYAGRDDFSLPTLVEMLADAFAGWNFSGEEFPGAGEAMLAGLAESIQGGMKVPVVLPHPDFSSIRIHRGDSESGEILEIDLTEAIDAATTPDQAQAADVKLQAGDRVELPLKKGDGAWTGFSEKEERFFGAALSGGILVTENDETELRPINWQPVNWTPSDSGLLPFRPADGWPTTRAEFRFVGRLESMVRDGQPIQGSLGNVFLRSGDQVQLHPQPQVRQVPPLRR